MTERPSLYRSELIADLPAGSVIYLLDSPSAVDAMWGGGAPAVSPSLAVKGWLPEYTSQLAGHNVVLIPSSGFPDSNPARDLARIKALQGHAASVKMTPPPGDGDLQDALTYIEHHSVADLVRWALEVAPVEMPHSNGKTPARPLAGAFTAAQLATMAIPPIQWVVNDLLPEGCILLAGRPKTGKSWLALAMGLAIASEHGRFMDREVVGTGSVLYLALEDTRGRLRRRMDQLEPDRDQWPARFHFVEEARSGPDGVKEIDRWCQQQTDAGQTIRLIVVDTLGRMRSSPKANASVYHEDLEAIAPLHTLAKKWHCVVVLVDHQRKAAAEDIFDTVTGSLAKTGTVDGTWVLERVRGQGFAKLSITGRDIEEVEMVLSFDASRGLWSPVGAEDKVERMPILQRKIMQALDPAGEPKTNAQIASFTGSTPTAIKRSLLYLERDGLISRFSYGKWVKEINSTSPIKGDVPSELTVPTVPSVPSVPDDGGAGGTEGTEDHESTVGTHAHAVEIESCPECGSMWPGASSITCSGCGYTGRPVSVGLDD